MIRHLDEFYVRSMYRNFKKILNAKKLIESNSYDKFLNKKLSLRNAFKVYGDIISTDRNIKFNINSNLIMLEYMKKFNILDEPVETSLKEDFFDKFSGKDIDDIESDIYEVEYAFEKFLGYICDKLGIYLYKQTLYDIIYLEEDDYDYEIFKELRKVLLGHMGLEEEEIKSNQDYIADNYFDLVADSANVYVFKDTVFSEEEIRLIIDQFLSPDSGVTTEMWNDNGNGYLCIAGTQFCTGLSLSLVIVLLLIFYFKNERKSNE